MVFIWMRICILIIKVCEICVDLVDKYVVLISVLGMIVKEMYMYYCGEVIYMVEVDIYFFQFLVGDIFIFVVCVCVFC